MRRRLLLVALLLVALATPVRAAEWGLIRPGVSTMEALRARYGAPTRVGHAHGIVVRNGTLMGGADPRADGCALGY